MRRFWMTLGICLAVAGCAASSPPQAAYVTLLRDAMVEAARVKEPSNNPEQTVEAVRRWRSAQPTDSAAPSVPL